MVYKYKLSKNDLDEIRYFSKGAKLSPLAKKALTILSYTFGGIHHLSWREREKFRYTDEYCVEYVTVENLATWDSNKLTTLVVLAHELAVRVEISSHSFKYLKIQFWEREGRRGSIWKIHPTMDKVLKYWRRD